MAEITIKDKTRKYLTTHTICERSVLDFIQEFLTFNQTQAMIFLWQIRFKISSALDTASFILGMATPIELLTKLRGDLARNYLEHYPDCWLSKDYNFPEEFLNAFERDITSCYYLDQKIRNLFLYHEATQINRVEYLLNCDSENKYFGGIRSLGFSRDEAMALKKFIIPIRDYFNFLLSLKDYIIDEYHHNGNQEEAYPKEDEMSVLTDDVLALTPTLILDNAALIQTFYEVLDQLQVVEDQLLSNDVSLDLLEEKRDAVEQLLQVANLF